MLERARHVTSCLDITGQVVSCQAEWNLGLSSFAWERQPELLYGKDGRRETETTLLFCYLVVKFGDLCESLQRW